MAMNINNSENMSTEQAKKILTNVISKASQRSVQNAEYDKTVLATVQFCTEPTIGQYKIKYQNGYFTAYSQDTTVKYSNNAAVYVTIPKNNFSNRLLITGLATNDNTARTYITNYEGDQQFGVDGSEMIFMIPQQEGVKPKVELSTNSCTEESEEGYFYHEEILFNRDNVDPTSAEETKNILKIGHGLEYDEDGNPIDIIGTVINAEQAIKEGDGYLRFGATFKTNIPEEKRYSGDYGLVLRLRYFVTNNAKSNPDNAKSYVYKDLELSSMDMTGTPFNYLVAMPQYRYYPIDVELFDRIESIFAYVKNFPHEEVEEPLENDITITNISLFRAHQMYDSNNDKYRAEIRSAGGFTFYSGAAEGAALTMEAYLRVDGNEVTNPKEQGLQYYWAIEDALVNDKNKVYYNQYTGVGWRCINSKAVKKYKDGSEESLKPLNTQTTIVDYNNETITQTDIVEFDWMTDVQSIPIFLKQCPAEKTKVKCVIIYNNMPISAIQEITNQDGIILLMDSSNGNTFYGGLGDTTLTIGAFKKDGDNLRSITLPDASSSETRPDYYIWTFKDAYGKEFTIPQDTPRDLIYEDVMGAWLAAHEGHDDENVDDDAVSAWLAEQPDSWARCTERYDYYNSKYTYYKKQGDASKRDICKRRKKDLINVVKSNIQKMYRADVENSSCFILGPSQAEGIYTTKNNTKEPKISNTTPYYYSEDSESGYQKYQNVNNTLLKLTGGMVGQRATIQGTAVRKLANGTEQSLGTVSYNLVSADASNLDYSIELTNGTQGYTYTVGGIAPTSKSVSAPITILPIYFKLYDKKGSLIYNSELNQDSSENKTDIATLKPVWTFYKNSKSLIQTAYQGSQNCKANPNNANILELSNESFFEYTLAEDWDIKKRDKSYVKLTLQYDNQEIFATTNLMFVKEGELGTNGTNRYLDIKDVNYEGYKSSVLSNKRWSTFDGVTYSPDERHLKNTYMYATLAYDGSNPNASIKSSNFVNLKFAQGVGPDAERGDVEGSQTITLLGDWFENGMLETAENCKWSTIMGQGYSRYRSSGQKHYSNSEPPFSIGNDGIVNITKYSVDPDYAYKPTKIDDYPTTGHVGVDRVSSNTIQLISSKSVSNQVDPVTKEPIVRENYAYYPMPFFYFHMNKNGKSMSNNKYEHLDPAKHIVIVGGYDEVVYDSNGQNPEYNKQPFKFYLLDEDGDDITHQVVSNGIVEWTCSDSLIIKQNTIPAEPKAGSNYRNYEDYGYSTDLKGKYTLYEGFSYKCIVSHTKPKEAITINGTTYPKDAFIADYWQEVNIDAERNQSFTVVPPAKYETAAMQDMFNSWVSLYVRYNYSNSNYFIEAAALIPINTICNKYGSEELNGWNGKETTIDEAYVLSSKVAAGRKYKDNSFVGVTIGENFYKENQDRENEIGLFAYGMVPVTGKDKSEWQRTAFLDAQTGRLILGPSGASQIVLNPNVQLPNGKEQWSKLNGWYISPNYFYKPIGEGSPIGDKESDIENTNKRNETFTKMAQGDEIVPFGTNPNNDFEGSAGMWVPWFGNVDPSNVFLWASSKLKDLGDETISKDLARYKSQLIDLGIVFKGDEIGPKSEARIRTRLNNEIIGLGIRAAVADWIIQQMQATGEMPAKDPDNPDHTNNADLFELTTLEDVITARNKAQSDLTNKEIELNDFNELINDYIGTLSEYKNIQAAESSGHPTSYKDSDANKKKSNFYVTYGGHLHAASADIEGHLVATSGRFGNGSNKVSIAIQKDNKKYILYNKNFWIEDTSGEGNEATAVHVNGNIMAKSGQFGRVGENVDGYSSSTVFIEYTWYPWHLPGDNEPWDDAHCYLDTSSGKNTKYALYHKNFYIKDNTGEAFFRGEVYAEKGRIGNWVLTKNQMHSYDGEIILSPSTGLKLGAFTADKAGNLNGESWYIRSNGSASFEKVEKMVITGPSGSTGGVGLKLANGQAIEFGDNSMRMVANSTGFTFEGKATFRDDINLTSGKSFSCTGVSGGIYITDGEIHFGSTGGSEGRIDSSGNANFKSFKIGGNQIIDSSGRMTISASNLIIGGQDIESYVKSVISSVINSGALTASGTTGVNEGHSHSVSLHVVTS